jgi:CheY-like chemotaxis protein
MEKKKVLIVDDEDTSREIALFDIRDIHNCDTAVDAFDAYNKIWKAIADGTPYDVMVLDEIMPGMDGVALLKIVKTNEKHVESLKDKPMKFVMMSDVASEKYIKKIYMTVLDERCVFIKKPIGKGQLEEIIKGLFI